MRKNDLRGDFMGRELKRVPLDFDAPIDEIWEGYLIPAEMLKSFPVQGCEDCKKKHGNDLDFCMEEDTPYCIYYNPIYRDQWYHDPPIGEGFQLWETTSEGSPISPVFASVEELADWCTENATTFASCKATKEQWLKMFDKGCVYHRQGNVVFV